MSATPAWQPYPPPPYGSPYPAPVYVPPPMQGAPIQPVYAPGGRQVYVAEPGGPGFVRPDSDPGGARIAVAIVLSFVLLGLVAAIFVPSFLNQRAKRAVAANGPPPLELPVDGHSNLPGDHASLTYEPLSTQREWVRETNIDAPYDGSQWWIACSCSDDYMRLGYFTYQPPIDTPDEVRHAVAQEQAAASADAGEPLALKEINVGGSVGHEFRYRNREGREIISVLILGPVNSYRFECNVGSRSSPKYAQCEQALATLRVDP